MHTNERNNAMVIVFENEQFNIVIIKKHAYRFQKTIFKMKYIKCITSVYCINDEDSGRLYSLSELR